MRVAFDVEVPMRDGVILRGNLWCPEGEEPVPAILVRTPYKKKTGGYERFIAAGYAVLAQDSRGRFASEGDFIPYTERETREGEDGYDTVEWMAKQPWCNGKIGGWGASYEAWMLWKLAALRPPHLVAMNAFTIPIELTEVDWPGVFRTGRRIKWWLTSMAPEERRRHGYPPPHTKEEALEEWAKEGEEHWLRFLPWKDFPRMLPSPYREYCESWLAEPNRRPWGFEEIHREVDVPNLDFSGWYDHCNGSIRHLPLMQVNGRTEAARKQTKLVIGPWNHPQLGEREIFGIDFGGEAEFDKIGKGIRWFDFWLKGEENGILEEPPVQYFVMGRESDCWERAESWPPEEVEERVWELGVGGRLWVEGALRSAAASGEGEGDGEGEMDGEGEGWKDPDQAEDFFGDTYVSDPYDPIPTLWGEKWFAGPSDRRVLEGREDLLRYRSEPMVDPVEISGNPEAVLWVSSTARDADFFVRLVDEFPDGGPALEVCYGMVRLRHRNTIDREEFVEPNTVVKLRIPFGPTAVRFRRGHRIRLEICSSDFPNYDRNHQTGGDDLSEVDFQVAEQTIHLGGGWRSRLILPVRKG